MNTVQDTTKTQNTTPGGAQTGQHSGQPADAWYAQGGAAAGTTGTTTGTTTGATNSAPRIEAQVNVGTKRMLYRHPSDKLVGGVCGGIAAYFKWLYPRIKIIGARRLEIATVETFSAACAVGPVFEGISQE